MRTSKFFISALCLGTSLAITQTQAAESKPLKVCAAENEMPYSNEAGEGFENKLAELVGKALDRKVEYVTWTDPRYYLRDTLDKGLCEVAIGIDSGDPRVLTTQPYYRSGYVFISRKSTKSTTHCFCARHTDIRTHCSVPCLSCFSWTTKHIKS